MQIPLFHEKTLSTQEQKIPLSVPFCLPLGRSSFPNQSAFFFFVQNSGKKVGKKEPKSNMSFQFDSDNNWVCVFLCNCSLPSEAWIWYDDDDKVKGGGRMRMTWAIHIDPCRLHVNANILLLIGPWANQAKEPEKKKRGRDTDSLNRVQLAGGKLVINRFRWQWKSECKKDSLGHHANDYHAWFPMNHGSGSITGKYFH